MIVLDTHVLLWLIAGSSRLGEGSRESIRRAWGEQVAVSAVTFWEIGNLSRKRRIAIPAEPASLRRSLLRGGLREIPLDGESAVRAAQLANFHRDPADRLIVATALTGGHRLLTADREILDWPGPLARLAATD